MADNDWLKKYGGQWSPLYQDYAKATGKAPPVPEGYYVGQNGDYYNDALQHRIALQPYPESSTISNGGNSMGTLKSGVGKPRETTAPPVAPKVSTPTNVNTLTGGVSNTNQNPNAVNEALAQIFGGGQLQPATVPPPDQGVGPVQPGSEMWTNSVMSGAPSGNAEFDQGYGTYMQEALPYNAFLQSMGIGNQMGMNPYQQWQASKFSELEAARQAMNLAQSMGLNFQNYEQPQDFYSQYKPWQAQDALGQVMEVLKTLPPDKQNEFLNAYIGSGGYGMDDLDSLIYMAYAQKYGPELARYYMNQRSSLMSDWASMPQQVAGTAPGFFGRLSERWGL